MKKYIVEHDNRASYLTTGELAYFINRRYSSFKLGESPAQIESKIIEHFDSMSFKERFYYNDMVIIGYTNKEIRR